MSRSALAPVRRRVRRLRRTASVLAVTACVAAVAPGCGAQQNLAHVASEIQASLLSMPGVTDAWVYHETSDAQGIVVNISVDVSTATAAEIAAVAGRIRSTRVPLIANYLQNVQFWVVPNRPASVSRHSRLDPVQVADDSVRLRALAANLDGTIDWFRGDDPGIDELAITGGDADAVDVLDSVQAAGVTATVSVSPESASRRTPRMLVAFPLQPEQQASILEFLASTPADIVGVEIADNAVRELEIAVSNPAGVVEDLAAVIDSAAAVTSRPLWVRWYGLGTPAGPLVFGGSVEIQSCSALPAVEPVSQRLGVADDLQRRVQSAVCGASNPSPPNTGDTQPAPPLSPAATVTLSAATSPTPASTDTDLPASIRRAAAAACPTPPGLIPARSCPASGPVSGSARQTAPSATPTRPLALPPHPTTAISAASMPMAGPPPAGGAMRPAPGGRTTGATGSTGQSRRSAR
ncbi:hypothetical protein ACXDF8_10275 [Mycolicibacterium sp. CBM1]